MIDIVVDKNEKGLFTTVPLSWITEITELHKNSISHFQLF